MYRFRITSSSLNVDTCLKLVTIKVDWVFEKNSLQCHVLSLEVDPLKLIAGKASKHKIHDKIGKQMISLHYVTKLSLNCY